jgi:two-component sensor histidine kinase
VDDNGVGLPADLDVRDTETLGLQLVRDLAEGQLGGSVEVDRDNGTQFKIRLKGIVH